MGAPVRADLESVVFVSSIFAFSMIFFSSILFFAVTYGCGTTSTENCTYFTNTSPVAGTCSHTVSKRITAIPDLFLKFKFYCLRRYALAMPIFAASDWTFRHL